MFVKIADNIVKLMLNNKIIEENKAVICKWGISHILDTVFNITTFLIIGILFKMPIETIVFTLGYIPLRIYAGGYHAKTYFMCNALFILTYLLVYYINSIITMFFEGELFSRILMSLILLGIIPITAFAPVQHKHKLLSQKQARISQIIGIVVFFLISIMALVLHFNGIIYGSFIIITLTSVSVLILIEVLNPERRKTND